MAISQRANVGKQYNSTTSSMTVNKPTDAVSGDYLIAAIGVADAASDTAVTPPAGWNLILQEPNSTVGGGQGLFVFYKIAGSSEPASYTFTLSGSVAPANSGTICASYYGASALTVNAGTTSSDTTGPSLVSASITTDSTNQLVITAWAQNQTGSAGSYAASSPGGLTIVDQQWDADDFIGVALFKEARAAAAGGAHTVTQNTGGDNTRGAVSAIFALEETAGAAGYSAEVLVDSPVAYWKMDESLGLIADSVGVNHATTQDGTPSYHVLGPITSGSPNYAIDFTRTNAEDFLVDDATALDLGDVLTCEVWFKRKSSGTGGREDHFFNKGTNAYNFVILDDRLVFAKANVSLIVSSTNTITDTTTWHHGVFTKNGATNKIYFDGTDVTGAVTNATLANTSDGLIIGSSGAANHFDGSLAHMALYPTALSLSRVQAHYNAATTGGGGGGGGGATKPGMTLLGVG